MTSLAPDLELLSDHHLLLGGVTASIAENRATAEKWARMLAYFQRRVADDGARHATSEHFALTAREQTVIEVGELWGIAEPRLRSQLNIALWLSEHFTFAWDLCRTGQLDGYRATLIADAGRTGLGTPEEYAALAVRIERFLRRHLKAIPGIEVPMVTCTAKQLRNKLAYEVRKLRAATAQERFTSAHQSRDVRGQDGEDGMSWLTLAGTTDRIQVALHRLTLTAKKLRAGGDSRTLDQLRADIAVDLLIRGETQTAKVPTYARPVVHLTVPIQTVMGLSDSPGVLSGGTVIPPGLARMIAQQPDSSWYRMLTDATGEMVEVSTKRYKPTAAIVTQVVAERDTCFRSCCDKPSTTGEHDHRDPWPWGATTGRNLWPACETDHKAKHAPGFRIEQTETGGFALLTPAGFRHETPNKVQPTEESWPEICGVQFSATELVDAVGELRATDKARRPVRLDLDWEYQPRNGSHFQIDEAYDRWAV